MTKMINLGRQGLNVPAVGLGCMGMSEFYGDSDDQSNLKVLDRAAELGCTFWDTADMYGPFRNEELVAKALVGRRDKITLATKFGVQRGKDGEWLGVNGRPEYIQACCDASLKRLGTDYIDLYYQHRIDPDVAIEESVGAMAELVEQGKVRYIGLSEADADTIERGHQVHPISALQTEYSLWSRDIEEDILPMVRKLGIGFVAYSPLGRGFLTGTITKRDDLKEGDWRLENPRFQEQAIEHNTLLVAEISAVAKDKNVTAAQIALAWVLAQGDDISTIPGTRRIPYLEQNWQAMTVSFTASELERLGELAQKGVSGERY